VRVAILGPGGVGGLVAAALARTGEEVIVVAREPTAALIASRGIAVSSARLGDFTASPDAVARLTEDVEVLVVATKATALETALERVAVEPGLVVPLLNGLEHLDLLRRRFGAERVLAAVIRVESDRPEPGQVVQTSPFLRVDIAGPAGGEFAAALERAGIPVRLGGSEAEVMWSKLVRLNALALTTSAYDLPIGEIRSEPERRRMLEAAVTETAAVAAADGAAIDPAATLAELSEAHPGLTSSMQRDIAAGRKPELDAIAGAVLRAAARHGVPVPTVAELARRVAKRSGCRPEDRHPDRSS
jgi:2-dehydropantoate 2-reductase